MVDIHKQKRQDKAADATGCYKSGIAMCCRKNINNVKDIILNMLIKALINILEIQILGGFIMAFNKNELMF